MKPKNSHFLLFILPALFLISCQKEYGYYDESRLKIVADLASALAGFEEQNEGDFILDEDHAVRVNYFVYDAAGNLCADAAEYASDYYQSKVHYFDGFPLGDYTLIVATDVVKRVGKSKSYASAYWDFAGVDRLSSFVVNGLDEMDTMGERLLTLTTERFSINGRRKTQRVSINVEPVTAMICTTFLDIFHWDKHTVPGEHSNRLYNYFDLSYKHDYNIVSFNPSRDGYPWLFGESTTEFDYYLIDRIYPDNVDSKSTKSIYGFHAVLPGKYNFTGYGEYTFGGNETTYSSQTRTSGTVNVEPGMMYYVDFDIEDWEVDFEGSAYSRSERPVMDNMQANRRDEIHGSNVRHRP